MSSLSVSFVPQPIHTSHYKLNQTYLLRRTSFHPITNRKHHCRLCGRVVCALPPKKPNRLKPCSLLITADRTTGRIMPVPETIAYGVTKRPSMVGGSSSSSVQTQGQKDTAPKSFRICRECNAITAYVNFMSRLFCVGAFDSWERQTEGFDS